MILLLGANTAKSSPHFVTPSPHAVRRASRVRLMTILSMENFAQLFEESLTLHDMRVGEVITAEVVAVDSSQNL